MKPATVFSVIIASVVFFCVASAEGDKPLFGGAVELSGTVTNVPIDPGNAGTLLEKQIASLLFPRLLELGENGNLRPGIVESWSRAADQLSVTLTLHPGHSSAGPYVTAADLTVSLAELLKNQPKTASSYILQSISGVKEFQSGKADSISGLEVLDERTIRVVLDQPQDMILYALADITSVPTRYSIKPDNIASSRGPFVKNEGDKISFTANINYYQGRPFLDHVLISSGAKPDENWRRKEIIAIDPELTGEESSEEDHTSLAYPGQLCTYLVINPKSDRMVSAEVRASLVSSIDVDAMVKIFFGDRAERLPFLVPESSIPLAGLVDVRELTASTQKALSGITLCYPKNKPDMKLVAERIKVELLVAGIEVELRPGSPKDIDECDLFLHEALVFDPAPEISLWSLLVELSRLTGSDDLLLVPGGDSLQWMLDVHAAIQENYLITPLYSFVPYLTFDHRLKDVAFRFDGTLNLESAWITSAGE